MTRLIRKPENIPSDPCYAYTDKGWTSWGDFLGNGNVHPSKIEHLPFSQARKFVKKLKLKGVEAWKEYCKSGKKPDNIPSYSNETYKDKGWILWGNFLGTGYVHCSKRKYISFQQARKFVKNLKLRNVKKWHKHCKSDKMPNDIPKAPEKTYKDKGWTNWGDFLGTENVFKKNFISFKQARKYARSLKLKNMIEWQTHCRSGKKPDNIPTAVWAIYKNKGWVDWYNFSGKKK